MKEQNELKSWGTKLPIALIDELDSFKDGIGLTSAEFLEVALSKLKAEQLFTEDKLAKEKEAQLDYHCSRIKEVLIALVNDRTDHKNQFALEIEQLKQGYTDKLTELQEKHQKLNEEMAERQEFYNTILMENEAYKKRNEELESTNSANVKTISLYEEKISEQNSKLEKMPLLVEENNKLVTRFKELIKENEQTEQQRQKLIAVHDKYKADQEEQIAKLKARYEAIQEESKAKIEALEMDHLREIANLKRELNLECQEQIIRIRQEQWESYQAKLDEKEAKIEEKETKIDEQKGIIDTLEKEIQRLREELSKKVK